MVRKVMVNQPFLGGMGYQEYQPSRIFENTHRIIFCYEHSGPNCSGLGIVKKIIFLSAVGISY